MRVPLLCCMAWYYHASTDSGFVQCHQTLHPALLHAQYKRFLEDVLQSLLQMMHSSRWLVGHLINKLMFVKINVKKLPLKCRVIYGTAT